MLLALLLLPEISKAATVELAPGDDWCGALRAAAPMDTILLAPGEYAGPCTIDHGGTEGAPVTIAAADPDAPPHIVYTGTSSNVIDVLASDVTLRGLAFGPTEANIDAVKIKDGSRVAVEDSVFTGIGGISVSANSADGANNAVLACTFTDLNATALYFGCHDGSCVQTDVRIEDNTFDGVTSDAVGYALEIKLDSWGMVARNSIRDTKGPGIEIYGSSDPSGEGSVPSVVEQNLVWGGASGAIEIGGGPAIVRNNIVVGSVGGGIVSYDYGGRGLVHGVHIVGNTAIGDGGAAIAASGWSAGADLELWGNAVYARSGGSALPAEVSGVPMASNLECGDGCFVDAATLDLWPAPEGGLVDAAEPAAEPLVDDFCGRSRDGSPDIGALERSGGEDPGALGFGPYADFDCALSWGDTAGTDEDAVGGGCGCASTPIPASAFGFALCASMLAYRRRRAAPCPVVRTRRSDC